MNSPVLSVCIQCFAIAILFCLLVYSTMQKPSAMQKHISVLIISSILFLAGYLVRLFSDNLQTAMIGAAITYTGQPFVMLSAMMLISTFYNYRIPDWLFIALAFLASLVPISVFSNSAHYLFYSTVGFDAAAKYSPLVTTHGPLYNLNLVYAGGLLIADIAMILRGYKKSGSPVKRNLSVYTVLMLMSGAIGYILYFLKLTGGYDTTMLGISIGAVFLSVLFFRCRIFDVIDKTKDYALDNSSDGVIIYDDAGHKIYRNQYAKSLLNSDLPNETVRDMPEGLHEWSAGGRHYDVNVMNISNGKYMLGKSVRIHDNTESVNNQIRLEEAVRETTEHIETIQRAFFASMASVVESRSLETGEHINRVSKYTEMIARSLRNTGRYAGELTDEYISILVLSAPLHDIGKISIPDAVLLKPGRLSPEEFEIMKTHADKGADIIEKTMEGLESEEYIAMASRIARCHHERWDGTGYPAGLKGEEIPLCARIVALADCYDAMTSERCYKEAFPNRKALNIIMEERGTHFDPDVVDAFLQCRETDKV